MNLEEFFELHKKEIERTLKVLLENDNRKIEYFSNSGKRLRPLLCLLAFKACNGSKKNYSKALDLAVAIELQHSASLVHDDIIDGDDKRRNKASYHKVFGVEDAILMGHQAIVLGLKNVLRSNPKIMGTFLDVWQKSLIGEIKDLEVRKNFQTLLYHGEEQYFDIITNKTALLFAGAAKIGCQQAGASDNLAGMFWEYGKQIGVAYQLADDSKDLKNGDLVSILWIIKQLDLNSRIAFISGLNEGIPPAKLLSRMNINVQTMFATKIAKSQFLAESLAKELPLPENGYHSMLLDAPKYLIGKCLDEKGG